MGEGLILHCDKIVNFVTFENLVPICNGASCICLLKLLSISIRSIPGVVVQSVLCPLKGEDCLFSDVNRIVNYFRSGRKSIKM